MDLRTSKRAVLLTAPIGLLVVALAPASCKPKTRQTCIDGCDATRADDFKKCDKHPSQRNCTMFAQDLHTACWNGCDHDFPETK